MDANGSMEHLDISHHVFQNNPVTLESYTNKFVSVERTDGIVEQGYVYTIDPVSGCVVLVTVEGEEAEELNFVMGHAVQSIRLIDDNLNLSEKAKKSLERLVRPCERNLSASEILKAKEKAKSWLSKHLVPFEETAKNELNIMDALVLRPPYGPDDCVSSNEIVLGKIQGIIKAMPDDVQEW